MSYDRKEKYKEAIQLIKEHELYFASDIIAYLGICEATFYEWWNKESKELKNLKELLDKNRTSAKVEMRKKWKGSDNATLQVALMKLISTDSEAHRLNGSNQKIEHSGEINIKPKEWIKSK